MIALNRRSNVRTQAAKIFGIDLPVVIFEDHRYSLVALWHAFETGTLDRNSPPDLIRFDYHDDGKEPNCGIERLKSIMCERPSLRDFQSFVEWELSEIDDDWVKTAMELGLVRHIVTFGAERATNFCEDYQSYEDHRGFNHSVWMLSHLWDQFGYQAKLTDRHQREKNASLWETLRWNGSDFIPWNGQRPFVVDIDLDCFCGQFAGALQAWPTRLLQKHFAHFSEAMNARTFLQNIMAHSAFLTIATEPDYCGGMSESMKVLSALDDILFDEPCLFRDA
jgi:hypothetical protein